MPAYEVEGLYKFLSSFVRKLTGAADDDWCDRVHRLYSAILFGICAIFLAKYSYLGSPIHCWLPGQLREQANYIHDICWISNTYWLPFEEDIPGYPGMQTVLSAREDKEISYYQWIPIILMVQALSFYFPRLIWRALSGASGIQLKEIVKIATGELDPSKQMKKVEYLARYIDTGIDNQREYRRRESPVARIRKLLAPVCCLCFGKRHGIWLFPLYMLVKTIYLGNVIVQLFLLNWFMKTDYKLFGYQLFADIISKDDNDHSWRWTGVFPRVTMCDFLIRVLGNLHRHTVQCVLPVNMFSEKLFIIIWFWLFILVILTAFNALSWIRRMLFAYCRRKFIRKQLKILGRLKCSHSDNSPAAVRAERNKLLSDFLNNYLRMDGVFVLMLIKLNAGQLVFANILDFLWEQYTHRSEVSEALKEAAEKHDGPMKEERKALMNSLH